nr:hypothetical protein [Mycoplasmopsis bovis]
MTLVVLVILHPNTTPQTQDNQNHLMKIILKKKNKIMTLMVLVILLQDTNPQIQDNQNHQENNIKEKEKVTTLNTY